MITITPAEYYPFKKRVQKGYIALAILSVTISAFVIAANLGSRYVNPPVATVNHPQMAMSDEIILIIFLGVIILFLFTIPVLANIKVLDSVIIDEDKKKIRITLRKYDQLIEKGEFDIDDKLKVKIKKAQPLNIPMYILTIKSGRKTLVSQSNAGLSGSANWTHELFLDIQHTIESIE